MMYSGILSLICTVWVLLVPCAARVIVRDTEGEDLWLSLAAACERCDSGAKSAMVPIVHDKAIPNEVRVVLYAAETQSTSIDIALRQLNDHEKTSPDRARAIDHRANKPRQILGGNLRQPTIHEGVASWQPAIKSDESPVGGFLFEDAVHDKIVDS
ncbi:uncharacterized protein EDB93DRAFT_1179088 [Suillus bovinus]|uniref:uncharacterized protein n=1 Tax=Suillus bovinus TaxID=48563 RepID=UPI001B864644|nr:uncharacterized protein EDB93DRAFT_1179088 [Suillus bovinus]KAG2130830.1 hypothetical protein EDB93DRAFT_1179088 [Suillus bovinus]